MADPAAQLAPTGKLRVAIAIAPSPSAQFAIKDAAGHYRGVAIILGQALAKKLGVPVELIAHNGSGESRIRPPTTNGTWRSCRSTRNAKKSSTSAIPTTCSKALIWWGRAARLHQSPPPT